MKKLHLKDLFVLERAPAGGYRELIRVATPLVMSTASYTIMHFIDRVMLTRYSDITAAASSGGGILSFTFLSFFLGVTGYTNTFVAQYHGARNKRMVGVSVWHGLYLAAISGLICFLCRPAGVAVLRWIGHEPAVLEAEILYFDIMVAWAFVPLVNSALSSFFSGRGDTWTPLWVNVSTACANIALNYALIFGRWGFPELGIAGAAYATVAASMAGMAAFAVLVTRPRWRREYAVLSHWRFRWPSFSRLIRFGGPSGLSFGLDIAAFSLFVLLVGRLGKEALIASNVTLSINSLAFLPMLGVSMATSILVGQHIGAANPAAAVDTTRRGVILAVGYMTLMGVLFALFPALFFAPFRGEGISDELFSQVYHYGRWLLVMLALLGVFDGIQTTVSGALKGAGDTWFPMLVHAAVSWLMFVPGVYVMVSVLHLGIYWAWAWFVLYVLVLAIVFPVRFRSGRWKLIEIKETMPVQPPVPLVEEAEPHEV
ncbi:MATE family efflux transporter [bacterium]|nr:MATE family efflux transporter [bacterium]